MPIGACGGCSVGWNGAMESTATDAMPDDTDQTSQQPTSEPAEVATAQEEANPNPVMELALKDLQARREALEAEIAELSQTAAGRRSEKPCAGQSDGSLAG